MTAAPETGVMVTLGEIYAQVRSTASTVARIDTTLTEFRSEASAQLKDHEARIRADEANRWPAGPLIIVASVVGAVATVGTLFVTR